MAKAICQHGPWSVLVSPCRHGESVSTIPTAGGKPYFYLYDTLHSKLGVKLPFTHFERAILQALNVAPTQLYPNSWAFVRAFELLCEDLGKAPSLGVFFWFFSLQKTDKVGWTSLSNRPKRKLFKPFLESYKSFKTWFFKVIPSDSRPNLLLDQLGRPFFPLAWMHQPVVSVTVRRKDLKDWEDVFIKELEELPLLPSADIIKGTGWYCSSHTHFNGYSTHALHDLKKRAAQLAEQENQPTAFAKPLAMDEPPQRQISDEGTSRTPTIIGSPVGSDDRPSKRQHLETPDTVGDNMEADRPFADFRWDTLLAGRPPSPSVWGPSSLLGQAVDKGLASSSHHKVKQLGIASTCSALQQYATYSLVLARAVEKEFGLLKSQNKSWAERAQRAEADILQLSIAFSEAEAKVDTFRSANATLQEDLERIVIQNKELSLVKFDMELARDTAYSEMDALRQKCKDLEVSNLNMGERLASLESLLKQAEADV
ncbi:hypothetical protein CR513_05389, partial [Mucuna pruriens]